MAILEFRTRWLMLSGCSFETAKCGASFFASSPGRTSMRHTSSGCLTRSFSLIGRSDSRCLISRIAKSVIAWAELALVNYLGRNGAVLLGTLLLGMFMAVVCVCRTYERQRKTTISSVASTSLFPR
jgi:hypothetical protein